MCNPGSTPSDSKYLNMNDNKNSNSATATNRKPIAIMSLIIIRDVLANSSQEDTIRMFRSILSYKALQSVVRNDLKHTRASLLQLLKT